MAIDIAAQINYWRDGSADDIDAARTLLNFKKLRQAGFFIHLAIEKALKAHVVFSIRDLPPRSHDLLLLVERSGILITLKQRDFLGRIQMYCLEGRYPTELPSLPALEKLESDLHQAEELIQWLMSQLKNP